MNKNSPYLCKFPQQSDLCITIGSVGVKCRVWLSDEEALQLAYRLMALAIGGETQGLELQA
jgi:hypothetical protein